MSSEYIYRRKAVNIRGTRNVYTALFVESHSNNVDPHEPHWWVQAFVKQKDALAAILPHVHYCEDGMTRGPKGVAISGEHSIGKWREALSNAILITPGTYLDLKFLDGRHRYGSELPSSLLADFKNLAQELDCEIPILPIHKMLNSGETCVGQSVRLFLSNPEDADLIWEMTQRLKVQSAYGNGELYPVKASFLREPLIPLLESRRDSLSDMDSDRQNVTTVKSEWVMQESIIRMDLPMEGHPEYTYPRHVVIAANGAVLSTDPHRWFGKKLVELEAACPGSAESAYRKFKKLLKALPITDYKSLSVEVPAAMPASVIVKMPAWVQEHRAKLFESWTYQSGAPFLKTDDLKSLLAALYVSDFIDCVLLGAEKSSASTEQLCLIG